MDRGMFPVGRLFFLVLCAATGLRAEDADDYPLIFAAGEGDGETVEKLLASGVDVNGKSKDGETALHVSAIRGDLRTVRALLVAGAEVDARTPKGSTIYMTPSMWTVYHGHQEMFKLLLNAGASAAAADENGKTLLEMSQEAQQPDIEALIRAKLE